METDTGTAPSSGDDPRARPVGVVHYGLGPIGRAVAALVADRPRRHPACG